MWLVLIIFSLTFHLIPANSSECGVIVEDKILGWQTADLTEFPWLAILEYRNELNQTQQSCIGTLINKRYILTAATCVSNPLLKLLWNLTSVRLGEYNLGTEPDCIDKTTTKKICAPKPLNIGIEETISHENYSAYNGLKSDIALIRLAQDVQFSDYISPICLPKPGTNKSYIDQMVFSSGWGRIQQSNPDNIKRKIQLPIVNNQRCGELIKSLEVEIEQSEICVGGVEGMNSCLGDTGGPLMVIDKDERGEPHWYGIGVGAFGVDPCMMDGRPGVYARISSFMDWITSKMRV